LKTLTEPHTLPDLAAKQAAPSNNAVRDFTFPMEIFVAFRSSSKQIPQWYLKLSHDRFDVISL
jgi:hypothetical protein